MEVPRLRLDEDAVPVAVADVLVQRIVRHAVERADLGFTEAIDIGQEQIRHLLQHPRIRLGRLILCGAGRFRD